MENGVDTEVDANTADKAEIKADAKTVDEVGVRTRRRGTRWTERRWAAPAGDDRGGENGRGQNGGMSPRR